MGVVVERAAPRHAYDIDDLLRTCFARPAEAMLVKQLAMDGDLVLALIARDEESGATAGLVALSKMHVAIGGDPAPAIALAPLAVMPDYRHSGVAAALVTAAIEQMRQAGALLMFVLGEPGFYERFGFATASAEGFDSPYAGPYFMALELQGGLPCGPRGIADHAPAFAALAETDQ
ncbi:GNAT family N-acetyltransferase [Hephaestia sp. GCM10023244]|uniref:GNAT family N-acetyltransferase n=1 Tax=unclassified Hephaestia TaxID=2631281 RepID=UPI00207754F6|nr:N-acetyltransferase [Hephaestia sp. MAHUQ-44]MCM8730523.1 N-acetyltransferase [Hephaestia sp. MAHUQ-44]